MLDENGLYDPRLTPDDDDPPPVGGYRVRSEQTWALARDAYLSGETAEDVCARFDLGITTFRDRAKKGGWRRCDRPDPNPLPVDAGDDIDVDASYAELAEHALRQLRRAMARGQASAASSWMRLHDRLTARAKAEADEAAQAARAAAPPPARPVAMEQARERIEARRREGEDYVARRDGADAIEMADRVAVRVADIARRIGATDPRDTVACAAIEAELARLDAEIRGGAPKSPDKPNTPDPFFDGLSPSPFGVDEGSHAIRGGGRSEAETGWGRQGDTP